MCLGNWTHACSAAACHVAPAVPTAGQLPPAASSRRSGTPCCRHATGMAACLLHRLPRLFGSEEALHLFSAHVHSRLAGKAEQSLGAALSTGLRSSRGGQAAEVGTHKCGGLPHPELLYYFTRVLPHRHLVLGAAGSGGRGLGTRVGRAAWYRSAAATRRHRTASRRWPCSGRRHASARPRPLPVHTWRWILHAMRGEVDSRSAIAPSVGRGEAAASSECRLLSMAGE